MALCFVPPWQVSSLNLDRVRSMKNRMSRLIARVQKVIGLDQQAFVPITLWN